MTGPDRSNWSVARGCATFVGLVIVAACTWHLLTSSFNKVGWRLLPGDRVKMGLDLVDHGLLEHLTSDEVVDRLGQPDFVYEGVSTWELGSNIMGPCYLHVTYDRDFRVDDVRFESD